ncbi:hypothetical protein KVH02_33935 [Streptomyces olivaceus]|uniref:GIY-YIG domain-containing protein n=1 Tax=Streptomyces olivaceus TaxID=47716 RepID=A0ABS7WF19_STROV|nr:hypothetical protein [Streptomyces olivaceus]MBZ6093275.1 hypothetical protein [Streptomyces olivaceus]MBZ6100294.1 hypothetical protein [Streptomyces olivaceus]MBZ6121458.1 hypothetical protein [Streptomyces olivaceus]MBZ6156108.1 hypothetical protein [Streptomyces olivaceus]MBZ6302777.1 hypothetical protein [Streptomyces olivaceus]
MRDDGPAGPLPFGPKVTLRAAKAVYVVCGWSGRILYVGSTTVGVATRFAQHARDVRKTIDWTTAYVIPLKDDTPVRAVRRIEGRIGMAMGPERNKALPRITVAR